jgi:oxygen-independent coproporphyrinogen-3 oxidase
LRQPRQYQASIDAGALLDSNPLDPAQLPFEFMLNALRLVDGFSEDLFVTRTGLSLPSIDPVLQVALERGLLERPLPGRLRPTALGLRFLNDLQALFLQAPPGKRPGTPAATTAANLR